MVKYAAFLRGINVAGQKLIKMAALKAMMEELGYDQVSTYIQSGNILFESNEKITASIEQIIKKGIKDTFTFDVPVIVLPVSRIVEILYNNPFATSEAEESKIYYTLLGSIPNNENAQRLISMANETDSFIVYENVVYIKVSVKYSDSKFSNNMIEKVLKVEATTRNHATLLKMSH